MKLRSFVRLSLIVSVVLLCAAFAVFSYLRLHAADRAKDFNLYTLVPDDALAVVETDRMADLVKEINEMQCSKDLHFLYVSDLFSYLKNYLTSFVDDTPHGLSKQMNKMLLSFHKPDNEMNQVLYCALGADDGRMVEAFIHKYSSSSFPPKKFNYQGETIYIYPMSDGRFLSVYFTPDFLAVSFQKRLIEQVVEAYHSKKSLMTLPSFQEMYEGKHTHSSATVYLRMKSIDMGRDADSTRVSASLGCWAEFDLKFNENAIYCTGMSHGTDSTQTFIHALQQQKPIDEFPGSRLPASTFFYNCWAVSDKVPVFDFTAEQVYGKRDYSDYIKERDQELAAFFNEYTGDRIMSCLFHPRDTSDRSTCAVMSLPVEHVSEAENRLRALLQATPHEEGVYWLPTSPKHYEQYPLARKFRQYLLPRNTLLTQLSGITESAYYVHACFYRGEFLLAPNAKSLSAYIDVMERGECLEGMSGYEEGISSLSPAFNYLMMADMASMAALQPPYVRLMPNFFLRHADFFQHFLLSIQLTCSEGNVCPNVVLLYH